MQKKCYKTRHLTGTHTRYTCRDELNLNILHYTVAWHLWSHQAPRVTILNLPLLNKQYYKKNSHLTKYRYLATKCRLQIFILTFKPKILAFICALVQLVVLIMCLYINLHVMCHLKPVTIAITEYTLFWVINRKLYCCFYHSVELYWL